MKQCSSFSFLYFLQLEICWENIKTTRAFWANLMVRIISFCWIELWFLPVQEQSGLHRYMSHVHTGPVLHSCSHHSAQCRASHSILANRYNCTQTQTQTQMTTGSSDRAQSSTKAALLWHYWPIPPDTNFSLSECLFDRLSLSDYHCRTDPYEAYHSFQKGNNSLT